jgi:SPP1 family phage portal protein
MGLMKTSKTHLSNEDILSYIANYEATDVREMNNLWSYYLGKNTKIKARKKPDPNNPSYNLSVSYGRKIVTTFTGYGWRPGYTTYKLTKKNESVEEEDNIEESTLTESDEAMENLEDIFKKNKENIKTNRMGRNIAICGKHYELVYFDGVLDEELKIKALPKWISIDPREMILLYNFDPDPKKIIAIHYYKIQEDWFKVEVIYPDQIEFYDRKLNKDTTIWTLTIEKANQQNYFKRIPVPAYYFGDEMSGLIKSVKDLIDAYDILVNDALAEFDRFAHAYLVMKKFGLTDAMKKKEPGVFDKALKLLKYRRVFEWVPADADIKFLTKDIPFQFIKFMTDLIREQIHIQSHVPDFTSEKMGGDLSGTAVERLMFDFENVVSSVEADADVGLMERLELITEGMKKASIKYPDPWDITIAHKRNFRINLKEYADTALVLKNTGFSMYAITDWMPDEFIPNTRLELARQKKEMDELYSQSLNSVPEPDKVNEEVITDDIEEPNQEELDNE